MTTIHNGDKEQADIVFFVLSPWNSLVISKTTFTLWTNTHFYFAMITCSELVRQVLESQNSCLWVQTLKAQNQDRFESNIIMLKTLLIFRWCYGLMRGAIRIISGCMLLALLYYVLHVMDCVTGQVFEDRPGTKLCNRIMSQLYFWFLVYMSCVCLLT